MILIGFLFSLISCAGIVEDYQPCDNLSFADTPGIAYQAIFMTDKSAVREFLEPEIMLLSESRARGISAGFTFGGIILGSFFSASEQGAVIGGPLLLASVIIGPSTGSIYGNDWSSARSGIAVRSGAILTTGIGVIIAGVSLFSREGAEGTGFKVGAVIAYTGFGILTISSIYDMFVTSARSVRAYNEAKQNGVTVALSPWISTEKNHSGGGLKLQLNF